MNGRFAILFTTFQSKPSIVFLHYLFMTYLKEHPLVQATSLLIFLDTLLASKLWKAPNIIRISLHTTHTCERHINQPYLQHSLPTLFGFRRTSHHERHAKYTLPQPLLQHHHRQSPRSRLTRRRSIRQYHQGHSRYGTMLWVQEEGG